MPDTLQLPRSTTLHRLRSRIGLAWWDLGNRVECGIGSRTQTQRWSCSQSRSNKPADSLHSPIDSHNTDRWMAWNRLWEWNSGKLKARRTARPGLGYKRKHSGQLANWPRMWRPRQAIPSTNETWELTKPFEYRTFFGIGKSRPQPSLLVVAGEPLVRPTLDDVLQREPHNILGSSADHANCLDGRPGNTVIQSGVLFTLV